MMEHTVLALITNSGGTGRLVDFQHNSEFLKKFLDNSKSAVQWWISVLSYISKKNKVCILYKMTGKIFKCLNTALYEKYSNCTFVFISHLLWMLNYFALIPFILNNKTEDFL